MTLIKSGCIIKKLKYAQFENLMGFVGLYLEYLFHTLKQNRNQNKCFFKIFDMKLKLKLIIQHPLFCLDDLMLCSYPVLNASVPGRCLQSLMESNKNCVGLIYLWYMRQINKRVLALNVTDKLSVERG